MKGDYERIYAVVRRVPRGRVATYGQVARLAGLPGHARQVGYAMHALTDARVPWQRVVNSRGEVSPRARSGDEARQRRALEREGVAFGKDGRIALARFQWKNGASAPASRTPERDPSQGPPPRLRRSK